MGLFSDLEMSDANASFAEAEKAAHLVSIDADDSFSVIVSQSQSQPSQSQQKPPETTLAAAAVLRLANKKKSPAKTPAKTPRSTAPKTLGAKGRLGHAQGRRAVSSHMTPRSTAAKTPGTKGRLGLSQSGRRKVSAHAMSSSDDDDGDFDLVKSQPGFPAGQKKRSMSRTQGSQSRTQGSQSRTLGSQSRAQGSQCERSSQKEAKGTPLTSTQKPGTSSARRITFSDSDSDFDMEKSQPLPKPKRIAQKPPKAAGSGRRSSTQPKGAYAEPELGGQDVLRAAPMRRLIKDILGDIKAELHPELHGGRENPRAADRVTGEALDLICRAAENHIEELFRLGYFATRHTGRTTIKPEDIRLAENMKKIVVLNRGLKY